jgi:hypothetical protein
MKIATPLLSTILGSACFSAGAQTAPASPSIDFIVSDSNPAIFYAARPLQKGDRLEINAHGLQGFQNLVIVPCLPDCANPSYAYTRPLRTGIQHLRIPTSGPYYFWLQGKSRDEYRSFRGKVVQTLLPITESTSTTGRFSATYGSGMNVTIRPLYTHKIDASAPTMGDPGSVAKPDSMHLYRARW